MIFLFLPVSRPPPSIDAFLFEDPTSYLLPQASFLQRCLHILTLVGPKPTDFEYAAIRSRKSAPAEYHHPAPTEPAIPIDKELPVRPWMPFHLSRWMLQKSLLGTLQTLTEAHLVAVVKRWQACRGHCGGGAGGDAAALKLALAL
ncbi:hypothetical protein PAPYR_3538 [Paratrimastix pyriformis]|uniref:Uncharacterized protein n=1 Tax=Paratrimastix pyriformis TaxID=342808 RepID=A0ABQ8ULU7_9EUKA|nr:hypothetical protein PAPYR_3538 [Paratrimastix pyriformis]